MNEQNSLPKVFAGIIVISFIILGSVVTFHFHGFVKESPIPEKTS